MESGTSGLRFRLAPAIPAALALWLAGCSSFPSSMNPVSWWHDLQGGKIAEERPPPPGADQPYPNLATVPPKPAAPDRAALTNLSNGLIADRTNAQHAAPRQVHGFAVQQGAVFLAVPGNGHVVPEALHGFPVGAGTAKDGPLSRARAKASEAIRRLMDLQPATARVLRGGLETEVPLADVHPGDIIVVRPGEHVAGGASILARWK